MYLRICVFTYACIYVHTHNIHTHAQVSAGVDPTERAISKLLYEAELETQKRDSVQQVLDKAKGEQVTVPNK